MSSSQISRDWLQVATSVPEGQPSAPATKLLSSMHHRLLGVTATATCLDVPRVGPSLAAAVVLVGECATRQRAVGLRASSGRRALHQQAIYTRIQGPQAACPAGAPRHSS